MCGYIPTYNTRIYTRVLILLYCVLCCRSQEFSQSLGVSNLSLCNDEVLIVWKWSWEEDDGEAEATALSEQEESSESLLSDTEAESHSLVFKCIGSTKESIIRRL